MVDIWKKCVGVNHIKLINETAWRIIEAQEKTSTRKLVDSLEEQIILEDLIESVKPKIASDIMKYHPLLFTPFRYPPLKHGSRFGKKTEPSLWYSSLAINTAMAEKAFYQANFVRASEAKYEVIQVPLTIFSVQVKTEKGIRLHEFPFSKYTNYISSPESYEHSQLLGSSMREADIQAFTYVSARNADKKLNIALLSVKAFLHKKPNAQSFQSWQCIVNNNSIEFIRSNSIATETVRFSINDYLINGTLPFPAN